jgi:hypothetical protein
VKDTDNIELGDTTRLYVYHQAFLAKASKLKKSPVVISNTVGSL